MKLGDITVQSTFCSIGCITDSTKDIQKLEEYVTHNFSVISKFPKIIVAHTRTSNITDDSMELYNAVWKKRFGDKCEVIERPNFGHTFGFTDLDKTVMDKSKELGYKYIWKSTNDVLLLDQIFNINMEDETFFYLQGHGIAGIDGYYKGNINDAVESFSDCGYKHFFPQTNFFITITSTDSLIDQKVFDEQYFKCISDPDYKSNAGQIEYKYLICEGVLRDFVYRNKLKTKHLISKDSYKKLIELIVYYRITDSSHKNIMFNECGICHYHFYNSDVFEI
jgi:hypothetical protein